MDDNSRFIAKGALLAAGLTVGFYLLAVAIIGVLLFVPYAEWRYANRIHFKILIVCLGAAAAIVAALVPPKDDFRVAGMRLDRECHPCLFTEVEDIAKGMDQAPPSEVYLVPEVNAWVTEYGRRGGSNRIMGLGRRSRLGRGFRRAHRWNCSGALPFHLSATVLMFQLLNHRGDGFRKRLGIAAIMMCDVNSVSL